MEAIDSDDYSSVDASLFQGNAGGDGRNTNANTDANSATLAVLS